MGDACRRMFPRATVGTFVQQPGTRRRHGIRESIGHHNVSWGRALCRVSAGAKLAEWKHGGATSARSVAAGSGGTTGSDDDASRTRAADDDDRAAFDSREHGDQSDGVDSIFHHIQQRHGQ